MNYRVSNATKLVKYCCYVLGRFSRVFLIPLSLSTCAAAAAADCGGTETTSAEQAFMS